MLRRWRRWWDARWQAGRDAALAEDQRCWRQRWQAVQEVKQSTRDPDEWRVEAIDYEHDGEVKVTIFSGRGAKARAFAYASFQREAP